MKNQSLYFIAIVPSDEIKQEIHSITEDISSRYDTRKALNSEPHITLIPPFWYPDTRIDHLKNTVSQVRKETFPFPIVLNGFATFPSRVLFINVTPSEELTTCYKRTISYLPEDVRYKIKQYHEYHPHITVAFKDISQNNFELASDEFLDLSYERIFELEEIHLFKHTGERWIKVRV